jgi:hypothetical protein
LKPILWGFVCLIASMTIGVIQVPPMNYIALTTSETLWLAAHVLLFGAGMLLFLGGALTYKAHPAQPKKEEENATKGTQIDAAQERRGG